MLGIGPSENGEGPVGGVEKLRLVNDLLERLVAGLEEHLGRAHRVPIVPSPTRSRATRCTECQDERRTLMVSNPLATLAFKRAGWACNVAEQLRLTLPVAGYRVDRDDGLLDSDPANSQPHHLVIINKALAAHPDRRSSCGAARR
jgi:hypothetical protein